MDILSFVIGFGILQAVLLTGLLVFSPRDPRLPNLFMAGLVIAISGRLVLGFLTVSGQLNAPPAWALPLESLAFTWGPLLYLYSYTMTRQHLGWPQVLHFLPALASLWIIAPYYNLAPQAQAVVNNYLWYGRYDSSVETRFEGLVTPFHYVWIKYRIHAIAFLLQFSIYCLLLVARLRDHNRLLQSHYSSLEQLNLRWLRTLTITCLIYIVVLLILKRIPQMFFGSHGVVQDLPYIALVLIIYMIVVAALYQPSILHGVIAASGTGSGSPPAPNAGAAPGEEVGPGVAAVPAVKYTRSGISLEDAQRFKTQLMDVTRQQQLFLETELTLPDLAAAAEITPHQVSQVLNGQLGQNFFTFINNYRINYAKELMADPDKDGLAIVDLAFEVGFKSKSSFYDAFKKAMNQTPAHYRKSLKTDS